MRSLFLRLFLWFWLAMALVAAVLVVTSPLFTRSRPGLESWSRDGEAWSREFVDRAASHVERHGAEGFPRGRGRGRGWGGGVRQPPSPARVFVLDEAGREVRGSDAPAEVADIAKRALGSGDEISERSGMLHLVARPVDSRWSRPITVLRDSSTCSNRRPSHGGSACSSSSSAASASGSPAT